MKTIRYNTFETNSSSTHSFTIINKKDLKEQENKYKSLVVDRQLIPANLKYSEAYVDISSSYDNGFILTAKSSIEKAALMLHHLKAYFDDYDYDYAKKYTEEQSNRIYGYVVDILTNRDNSYDSVDLNFNFHFNLYFDYGESNIETILYKQEENEDKIKKDLEKYILDIVFNDDIIIEQRNEPY